MNFQFYLCIDQDNSQGYWTLQNIWVQQGITWVSTCSLLEWYFCKIKNTYYENRASKMALGVKNPPANIGDARDTGLIPGSGRSLGVGNGNSLQYSCLGRGVWWATKSWIQIEWLSTAQHYENKKKYFSVDKYFFRSSDLKLLWCVQKRRHMQSCRHRSDLSGASWNLEFIREMKNFMFCSPTKQKIQEWTKSNKVNIHLADSQD